MKLNLTQLDQTAKLMHMFDDFFEDWIIDCDDVSFTNENQTITIKIASLSLDQSASADQIFAAINNQLNKIVQ
jgi:ribosome-associated translation inhibitor RaiA